MFTDEQKRELAAPLSKANVRGRNQGGRQVSYIEAWRAIDEANRIFGFGHWNRETTELKCVAEKERAIGKQGETGWGVTYIARVRVTIMNPENYHGAGLVREGCGAGHGIDRDLGQAHESALKEAESDAMKRALMTFGNPFGLALYDKEQTQVSSNIPDDPRITMGNGAALTALRRGMAAVATAPELEKWINSHTTTQALNGLSEDDYQTIKAEYQAKKKALGKVETLGAG